MERLSRRKALATSAAVGISSLALPRAVQAASGASGSGGAALEPHSYLRIQQSGSGSTFVSSTVGTADIGSLTTVSATKNSSTMFTFTVPSGYKEFFTDMEIFAYGESGEGRPETFDNGGSGAKVSVSPTWSDGETFVVRIGNSAAAGGNSNVASVGRGGRGIGIYKTTGGNQWIAVAGGGGGAGHNAGGGIAGRDQLEYALPPWQNDAHGWGIDSATEDLDGDGGYDDRLGGQGGRNGYVLNTIDRSVGGAAGYLASAGANGTAASTTGTGTWSLGNGGAGGNGTGTGASGSAGGAGGGSGYHGGGGGGGDTPASYYVPYASNPTVVQTSGGGGAGGSFVVSGGTIDYANNSYGTTAGFGTEYYGSEAEFGPSLVVHFWVST